MKMTTADSVEWFRSKNQRRKQAKTNGGSLYSQERKWRRSLLNGAFGHKEKTDD